MKLKTSIYQAILLWRGGDRGALPPRWVHTLINRDVFLECTKDSFREFKKAKHWIMRQKFGSGQVIQNSILYDDRTAIILLNDTDF